MSAIEEAKNNAKAEKQILKQNILLMCQFEKEPGKKYTPEELDTKSLKQLHNIWEKITK